MNLLRDSTDGRLFWPTRIDVSACPLAAICKRVTAASAPVLASAPLKVAAEVPVVAGKLTRADAAYDGLQEPHQAA